MYFAFMDIGVKDLIILIGKVVVIVRCGRLCMMFWEQTNLLRSDGAGVQTKNQRYEKAAWVATVEGSGALEQTAVRMGRQQ